MSLVVLGLVAAGMAAAGATGLLARHLGHKRRVKPPDEQQLPAPSSDTTDTPADGSNSEPDPFADLPLSIGDVVQFGSATRWPRAAIVAHCNGRFHCALLLSEEADHEQATAVLAPPDRNIYWLDRHDVALPPTPPTRLEIAGMLLDRVATLPVSLQTIGDAPSIGQDAVFAMYEGHVGDAAIIVKGTATLVWYGSRLAPDDVDNLGRVNSDDQG